MSAPPQPDASALIRWTRRQGQWVSPGPYILLGGLVSLFFVWFPGQPLRLEQFDLPKEVSLGVLGLLCATDLLLHHEVPWHSTLDAPVAACLCWGAVLTWAVAVNQDAGWRALGGLAAAYSVFLLARRVGAKPGVDTVYLLVCAIVVVFCALMLLEGFGVIPLISVEGRRPGATLGNRNLGARIACLCLPMLWRQFAFADRTIWRRVSAGMIFVTTAAIVLSRSRASMLVAAMLLISLPALGLSLGGLRADNRWRRTCASWFAAASIGAAIAVVIPNRLGWLPSDFATSAREVTNYQSGTGRGRLIQAQVSLRMIQAAPLHGVGPGNWSVVYPHYALNDDPSVRLGAFYPGPQVPRNEVLSFAAEFGAPGLLLATVSLATLLISATTMLRSNDARRTQAGLTITAICGAAAILGLFDSIIRVAPTVVLLASTTGLALGEGTSNAEGARDASPRWLFSRQLLTSGYALGAFVFARAAMQDLASLRTIRAATTVADLYRAVSAAPNNVEARMLLAYALADADRCDLATPHLLRALSRQPFSIGAQNLWSECEKQLSIAKRPK